MFKGSFYMYIQEVLAAVVMGTSIYGGLLIDGFLYHPQDYGMYMYVYGRGGLGQCHVHEHE